MPSSITISRVQSDAPKPGFPPGLSVQRMRGPPPLLRAGLPRLSPQQLQLQQRGLLTPQQQQQRLLQQRQHHLQMQLAQQRQQQQQQQLAQRAGGLSLHLAGAKRPVPMLSDLPSKMARTSPRTTPLLSQEGLVPSSRLCRVCSKSNPFNFLLRDKPEVLENLK